MNNKEKNILNNIHTQFYGLHDDFPIKLSQSNVICNCFRRHTKFQIEWANTQVYSRVWKTKKIIFVVIANMQENQLKKIEAYLRMSEDF